MAALTRSPTEIARATLDAMGVPGITAIALLAFCAAFQMGTNVPAQEELSRLAELRTKLGANRPALKLDLDLTPDRELEKFYGTLPKPDQIDRAAERIYSIGLRQGVTLRQGTYRYLPEKGARLARYEATYVAQTEYYRMRFMVRDLLKEMPNLSLDDVSMQRQQPSAAGAELTLKVSLYVSEDQ